MVQPADGGGATELLGIEHNLWNCCQDLAWSPDGTRIYFAKPDGVYSISRAGGQPELVLKQLNPFYFDLSPDGKALALWLVLQSPDHSWRGSVWISSPPGTDLREYKPAPFAVNAGLGPDVLRFSPDGKLLYLSIFTFSGNSVETWVLPIPAGTGAPRHIFREVPWHDPVEASWMPDSRRMVLSGSIAPSALRTLWLADTRYESLTKLTDGSSIQQDPDVSPDGRRLLFTRVEEDADIVELPLDGSPPRKLLATGTSEFSPVWSPKGGALAYLTRRNGSDELWFRSSEGDWERPVVTTREFPALMWLSAGGISPDGSHLAYGVVLRDPNRPIGAVYVSPTAGGAPTWIANGSGFSWSPDGASLAVWRLKPDGVSVLATVRIGSSQQPFEIPNVACSPSTPAWSPSGEWIACNTTLGMVLVSPDGKVRRTLPRFNVPPVWSKDSRTLYGLDGTNGMSWLVAEDIHTGAIRKVADYGSEIIPYSGGHMPARRLSLSPDGKSVAIGTVKRQTALWILEGFTK
jgi:Tol biopolymer transport system component